MLCCVVLCCVVLEKAAVCVLQRRVVSARLSSCRFLKIQQTFAWQKSFEFPPLRGWCRMTPRGVLPG